MGKELFKVTMKGLVLQINFWIATCVLILAHFVVYITLGAIVFCVLPFDVLLMIGLFGLLLVDDKKLI